MGRDHTGVIAKHPASRYLTSEYRAQQAAKRGGGREIFPWDPELEESYGAQLADPVTPEAQFDRSWAQALIAQAMKRLEQESAAVGREALFAALRPSLGAGGESSYAELGRQLQLSEKGVASALHRLRRRYGELLRAAIADTVSEPAEVDEELRFLRRVIAEGSGSPG